MSKTKIFDIIIVSSIVGMIVCLGIEVADKTNVGYDTMEDRLSFGWWFYMQGGREQALTELENISISNSTSPFINFLNRSNEMVEMKDMWRVIARRLYESDKNIINTLGNAL